MEARAHRGRPIRRERWSGRPRRIESNGVRSCRGACGACGAGEAGEARAASCWVGSLRDVPSSPLRSPVLDQSEPPAPVGLKRAPHCRLLSLVDVHDSPSVRPSSILPRDQPLRSRGPSGGRPDTSTRPDAVRHGRHAVSFHPGQGRPPSATNFFPLAGRDPSIRISWNRDAKHAGLTLAPWNTKCGCMCRHTGQRPAWSVMDARMHALWHWTDGNGRRRPLAQSVNPRRRDWAGSVRAVRQSGNRHPSIAMHHRISISMPIPPSARRAKRPSPRRRWAWMRAAENSNPKAGIGSVRFPASWLQLLPCSACTCTSSRPAHRLRRDAHEARMRRAFASCTDGSP